MIAHDAPLLLSITDTAARLSVSVRTVKALLQRNELPSVRLGARRLVHVADLQAFAERLRAGAAQ